MCKKIKYKVSIILGQQLVAKRLTLLLIGDLMSGPRVALAD